MTPFVTTAAVKGVCQTQWAGWGTESCSILPERTETSLEGILCEQRPITHRHLENNKLKKLNLNIYGNYEASFCSTEHFVQNEHVEFCWKANVIRFEPKMEMLSKKGG